MRMFFLKEIVLIDADEFDVKNEGGFRRDDTGVTALAVSVVGTASQLGFLTHRHLRHALVPSFDNLAHANGEFKGLSAVPRGVEFLSARQGAGVVDLDLLAVLGVGGAIAWLVSFDLNAHDENGNRPKIGKKKRTGKGLAEILLNK